MENAEQHIQNKYVCYASMNEFGGLELSSQNPGTGIANVIMTISKAYIPLSSERRQNGEDNL